MSSTEVIMESPAGWVALPPNMPANLVCYGIPRERIAVSVTQHAGGSDVSWPADLHKRGQ